MPSLKAAGHNGSNIGASTLGEEFFGEGGELGDVRLAESLGDSWDV